MAKILVADDEADLEMLIRQKFRRQIRESKYEFIFALNGSEALIKLEQHPDVDLVLSDINMPVLDGLSLLTRINEVSPLIKTVMVSAYGDMENIRSAMNRGAFDFVLKPVDFLDLELTIEKTILHTVQLRKTFQAIRENNILRMYVDETVLNFMTSKEYENTLLANETIVATVVFIDICNFTSISETQPANEVINLLNVYFDVIVKEIISHKGYVDKFIGDAVMAVFRGDYHLDRAIEASLAVRKQIEKLPDQPGNFSSKVSIGINSGEVISGNIGSATLKRLDYTVIGNVVNTAQRLQGIAQAGQIMITEQVYDMAKQSFTCSKIGEFTLKNKALPVTVYEVLE